MQQHPQFTETRLRIYTEALRRELYDAVIVHLWTREDSGDSIPAYDPDQAGLAVVFLFGRWFVFWVDLEEPDTAPTEQRIQVSRILAAPDRRSGIMLSEV